jgi:hypothetical protein
MAMFIVFVNMCDNRLFIVLQMQKTVHCLIMEKMSAFPSALESYMLVEAQDPSMVIHARQVKGSDEMWSPVFQVRGWDWG